MFKARLYEHNKVSRLNISEIKHARGLVWVDCTNPTHDEIEQLVAIGLEKSDIDDTLDPLELPRIENNGRYIMIIYRSPMHNISEISTTSLGIFLIENKIITIHKNKIRTILELHNSTETITNHTQFMLKLFDGITSNYLKCLSKIDEEIEALEEKVFKQASKKTAQHIFSLKKALVYFQKSLILNKEVISEIIKKNTFHLTKTDLMRFEDLHDDTSQLIDMANTHKELLTGALEIHSSTIANTMNEVMKRMTVIGSFVLIPTLIASIYGMNFGQVMSEEAGPWNMPELAWVYGYPFALGLMALSCILLYIFFKRNKWL